jgi:hypothetical protein
MWATLLRCHLRHDRGNCRGQEDQCVLRWSRPAAEPTGAGNRRGDPGWAAAGGDDAGGADETFSGDVGSPEIGPFAPRDPFIPR